MLAKNICLALLGFSAGITAAGGLFFIIGLGVISDFADRTHTGEQVMLYEDAVAAGGSLGAVISVYHPAVPFAGCLLPVMGLFGGIFVGCWAMALTEMLDLFPIFIRRIRMVRGIAAVMIGIAFGKVWAHYCFSGRGGDDMEKKNNNSHMKIMSGRKHRCIICR